MNVSVVIPCYNVEGYVEACLGSVLGQTHPDLEVICVDDGSTDGTVAAIERVQQRHPDKVKLLRQHNAGATMARNTGLRASKGVYVQFLDADDTILPGKIAWQLQLAQVHDLPDLIVGSYRKLLPHGEEVFSTAEPATSQHVWLDLMRVRLGITSANLWAREAVLAVGGWNEHMRSSQEYDLMFRLLERGARVVYDAEVLTTVHKRPDGSISQTNVRQNWERFVDLRLRILQHVHKHGLVRNEILFRQFLFDSIRLLYPFDKQKALAFHKQHIPQGFRPRVSAITGNTYVLLHRLFGFRLTQRIWDLLR